MKKQETLDEAIERLYGASYEALTREQRMMRFCRLEGFMDGSDWQKERSYSEEDMMKAVKFGELYKSESSKSLFEKRGTTPTEVLKRWFNEFKKK